METHSRALSLSLFLLALRSMARLSPGLQLLHPDFAEAGDERKELFLSASPL